MSILELERCEVRGLISLMSDEDYFLLDDVLIFSIYVYFFSPENVKLFIIDWLIWGLLSYDLFD